jgi:hypothetical protein
MKNRISVSGFVLCLFFFLPYFAFTQNEETEVEEDEPIELEGSQNTQDQASKPDVKNDDNASNQSFVKFNHRGAYIARYEITYQDENGKTQSIAIKDKTAGWQQTFYFNKNATQIRIKAEAMTGLVWDPWGLIYDKIIQLSELNKCYRNTGTTLNRQWDNECN